MKKSQAKESPTVVKNENVSRKKDYLEINLPKLPVFKNSNINYYLVIALVVLGFIMGMLTNKILFLQESLKTAKPEGSAAVLADKTDTVNNPQPTKPPKVEVAIGHLPTLGSDNAKVTVVEFSDFQCPFCQQFEENTFPKINDNYIKTGKIKFAYRQYPLTTIHPNAEKAAEASECANEQDKFWDYHAILFKNQSAWSPLAEADAVNSFADYAGQTGLNTDQFRSCLTSDKYKQIVEADLAEGNTAGVEGTPTFFVNGWRLVGAQPYEQIAQLIEQELKK